MDGLVHMQPACTAVPADHARVAYRCIFYCAKLLKMGPELLICQLSCAAYKHFPRQLSVAPLCLWHCCFGIYTFAFDYVIPCLQAIKQAGVGVAKDGNWFHQVPMHYHTCLVVAGPKDNHLDAHSK